MRSSTAISGSCRESRADARRSRIRGISKINAEYSSDPSDNANRLRIPVLMSWSSWDLGVIAIGDGILQQLQVGTYAIISRKISPCFCISRLVPHRRDKEQTTGMAERPVVRPIRLRTRGTTFSLTRMDTPSCVLDSFCHSASIIWPRSSYGSLGSNLIRIGRIDQTGATHKNILTISRP